MNRRWRGDETAVRKRKRVSYLEMMITLIRAHSEQRTMTELKFFPTLIPFRPSDPQ